MSTSFIAHTRDDGAEQPLLSHLNETARRAGEYAAAWDCALFAYLCGLVHDVGKYSAAFQKRVRGGQNRVDHATAGGQLLYEASSHSKLGILAAYCIMGHHGGIPNGGSQTQDTGDDATLFGRLKRRIEDYSSYRNELTLPRIEALPQQWKDGFDAAFFVRMTFSALVDADWLDTEKFCNRENAPRGGFSELSTLRDRFKAYTDELLSRPSGVNTLNDLRNGLLRNCLSAAKLPSGLFSLTAPTGSGKTVSSMAFALEHAVTNEKRRIIYIVPYNTIIEQNALVYEDLLGSENILRHYSDASYDGDDEASVRKRNSVENWDYPIMVTSSVQFFESLFSNKPSRCRKLHNIAGSVLIFDEAQMIPVPYLTPCVRAIRTLVTQYGCSAVLATATQSALDAFFDPLPIREITENPVYLYNALRRAVIVQLSKPLTDDELTERLAAEKQVLCIVNTRRHAQTLFARLAAAEPEGAFHLSTTMFHVHRKRVLDAIRERLKNGLPCRVVSTSLVEAGVDLDFETVYREKAGLDSVVQAAGRCNRENGRKPEESIVYVFESADNRPPPSIRPNIDACGQVARNFEDLAGLPAIRAYFEQLFYNIGEERRDVKKIVPMFNDGVKAFSFPFADASAAFRLIDDSAQQTVYVLGERPDLAARARSGERSRELFREMVAYAVTLFEQDIRALDEFGAIERPDPSDVSVLLLFEQYYDERMGVTLSPKGGQSLFG